MATESIAKRKRDSEPKSKTGSNSVHSHDHNVEATTHRGTNAPCENCDSSSTKRRRAKKTPMTKVGCWRGLFKETLDF